MRAPMGAAQGMTGPEGLLHAGHDSATPACQHSIVEDAPDCGAATAAGSSSARRACRGANPST